MGRTRCGSLGLALAALIGGRLRAQRKARHLTLAQLAVRTGVDVATISRLERGLMLGTLECHLKLAHALRLSLARLMRALEQELARHPSHVT